MTLEIRALVDCFEIGGCPRCDSSGAGNLYFAEGKWIFDTDDGLQGPTIYFCPFCGYRLPLIKLGYPLATKADKENGP
jgi:hypothetical protein